MRLRKPWLIALIVLLIITLLLVWWVSRRLVPVIRDPGAVIETELQTQLDREVTIESARITSRNRVIIEGLRVAQGDSFEEGTLLTARRVIIDLDLLRVLTGRGSAVGSIRSLTLVAPHLVLIRDEEGAWNIQDLLERPPGPPEERFAGVVRIEDGRLTVRDSESRLAAQPAVNTIESMNGTLDFRPDSAAQVNLTGRGEKDRIGRLSIRGPLGLGAPDLTNLNLRVTGADAGYWLDYFSTIRSWTLRGGVLNGSAVITQRSDGELTASGTADVSGSVITSPYLAIPLRNLNADVSFVDTRIRLRANALLRESPVRVAGRITAGETLDLRVTSDRMSPLTLQQAICPLPRLPNSSWPTAMSFNARVFGPTNDPSVRATASIPRAVVYGVPATNITAVGTYSDGVIRISDLRAGLAQGTGRFNAVVRLATGRTTVNGTLNNVSLAQLPITLDVPLSGITDATFSLEYLRGIRSGNLVARVSSGRAGNLRFTTGTVRTTFTGLRAADGIVQLTNGSLENVAFPLARANFSLRGDTISITQGLIDTAGGTIRSSGTVTTAGRLNLAVNADGVNLRTLLGPLGYEEVAGIASFDGRLSGTISSPLLTGALIARDGRLQQITFDFLQARITATPQYLLLANATIRQGGLTIATTGFVRLARGAPPQLDLGITAQQASLAQLAQLLGLTIDVQGVADVDLRITGRLPALQVAGTIAVTDATVAGLDVDSARIVLRTVAGRTQIEELVATRDGMRLIASGFIGTQGQLNLAFRGENLRLELLNPALSPYVVLSGPMNLTGTVAGTLTRPVVRGQLVAVGPEVNQVPFDRLAGTLRWDGVTISLLDAALTREDILYRIPSLRLNTQTQTVALTTSVVNARLERVLALFRNSPYLQTSEGAALQEALQTVPTNAAGDINATLNISGPVDNLSGTGRVTGANIVLGQQQIDSLSLGFVAQQSIFRFSDLAIRAPGVDLDAAAQFVAAEPTTFTVAVRDTQLGALLALIENLPFLPAFEFGQELLATARSVPRPASGVINASVSIADVQTGATGTITAAVNDLILDDQEIGDIAANARLIGGTVLVEEFNLMGPLATASIQGTIDPEQEVSLTGRVEGVSLALLGPMVGVPDLSGTVNMEFQAAGPLDAPIVQASLTATGVGTEQVRLQSITVPNLTIQAGRLDAPQIIVATERGQILASASLPFTWGAPLIPRDQPINVQISVPTQDLAELADFVPTIQSASGTASMNVAISGTIDDPETSGSLVVENGRFDVERFNNDFTDVQVDATFGETTLQINRFTGASSLGGTFAITGRFLLPSLNRAIVDATLALDALRLSTDNLTGIYEEEITMTATGLLNITESLRAPLIAGQLVVSDAVIEVPTGEFPTPGPPTIPGPNPRFDVTLNLASDVRIERGPLDVEVVGPVSIAGTLSQPNIIGTVAITGGSLRYPGRTFSLVPGGAATFVWQAPEPPSIAIDLQARTTAVAPSLFARVTRYTITLNISGTIDNPVINVTSSPPGLSEVEALALIFRQAEIEALLQGTGFLQIVEQQLGATLLGLALPGIFEGIEFGPFVLGIQPGLGVPFQSWVSLQITDQLTLSYLTTLISGETYEIFELSYLISPRYAFSVQLQDYTEVLYLLQAGWQF